MAFYLFVNDVSKVHHFCGLSILFTNYFSNIFQSVIFPTFTAQKNPVRRTPGQKTSLNEICTLPNRAVCPHIERRNIARRLARA
jgi:hypothetical protein